jgi:hypothetical protein
MELTHILRLEFLPLSKCIMHHRLKVVKLAGNTGGMVPAVNLDSVVTDD